MKAGGGRLLTAPVADPDAKGKAVAKHGESHCAGLPCPTDHVGWRTCHRDEGEGLNLKHEAPTRPMRGQELHLDSGLGLTMSLGPAVGDLLAEPN